MYSCPRCQQSMKKSRLANGRCYKCEVGHGTVIGLYLLQRFVDSKALQQIWLPSINNPAKGLLPCPSCKKPMYALKLPSDDLPFELDVCRSCHLIWFDDDGFFALKEHLKLKFPQGLPKQVEREIALAQVRFDGDMNRDLAKQKKEDFETLLRLAMVANPAQSKVTWALLRVLSFLLRWW